MRSVAITCLLAALFVNQAASACTETWNPMGCYNLLNPVCPQDVCGGSICTSGTQCKSGECQNQPS